MHFPQTGLAKSVPFGIVADYPIVVYNQELILVAVVILLHEHVVKDLETWRHYLYTYVQKGDGGQGTGNREHGGVRCTCAQRVAPVRGR